MFGKGGVAWSAWAFGTAEASVDYRQHLSTFPNPLVLLLKLCGLLWVKRYGQAGLAGSSLGMWFLRACYTVLFLVSVPRVKQRPDLQRAHCEIVLCQQATVVHNPRGLITIRSGLTWTPEPAQRALSIIYIFSACLFFSPENGPFWVGCSLYWSLLPAIPFSFRTKSVISKGLRVDCPAARNLSGWT